MKNLLTKILILFSIAIIGSTTLNAQEVGIRGGSLSGGNVALDATFLIGEFSRIHTDISFGEEVGIDLIWDFIYLPLIDESLFIYSGVGPYMLLTDPLTFGGAGEIGFEYRFDSVPIALGIDWRPLYCITEIPEKESGFLPEGFGLNLRFILDF